MSRPLEFCAPGGQEIPEKSHIGASFGRAASAYDRSAELQRQVGEDLLAESIDSLPRPARILDLGAGTGYCTARLADIFPEARLYALDIAPDMLHRLRARMDKRGLAIPAIQGDAERLPLADACLDLAFSNLALQWCANLPAVCADIERILRPGGRFLFSTFGAGTLNELREAWAQADAYTHVNRFLSTQEIDAALASAGFAERSVKTRRMTASYSTVEDLMRALKGVGAHNVTRGRARGLTGKGRMRAMTDAYRALTPNSQILATFEIVLAQAQAKPG